MRIGRIFLVLVLCYGVSLATATATAATMATALISYEYVGGRDPKVVTLATESLAGPEESVIRLKSYHSDFYTEIAVNPALRRIRCQTSAFGAALLRLSRGLIFTISSSAADVIPTPRGIKEFLLFESKQQGVLDRCMKTIYSHLLGRDVWTLRDHIPRDCDAVDIVICEVTDAATTLSANSPASSSGNHVAESLPVPPSSASQANTVLPKQHVSSQPAASPKTILIPVTMPTTIPRPSWSLQAPADAFPSDRPCMPPPVNAHLTKGMSMQGQDTFATASSPNHPGQVPSQAPEPRGLSLSDVHKLLDLPETDDDRNLSVLPIHQTHNPDGSKGPHSGPNDPPWNTFATTRGAMPPSPDAVYRYGNEPLQAAVNMTPRSHHPLPMNPIPRRPSPHSHFKVPDLPRDLSGATTPSLDNVSRYQPGDCVMPALHQRGLPIREPFTLISRNERTRAHLIWCAWEATYYNVLEKDLRDCTEEELALWRAHQSRSWLRRGPYGVAEAGGGGLCPSPRDHQNTMTSLGHEASEPWIDESNCQGSMSRELTSLPPALSTDASSASTIMEASRMASSEHVASYPVATPIAVQGASSDREWSSQPSLNYNVMAEQGGEMVSFKARHNAVDLVGDDLPHGERMSPHLCAPHPSDVQWYERERTGAHQKTYQRGQCVSWDRRRGCQEPMTLLNRLSYDPDTGCYNAEEPLTQWRHLVPEQERCNCSPTDLWLLSMSRLNPKMTQFTCNQRVMLREAPPTMRLDEGLLPEQCYVVVGLSHEGVAVVRSERTGQRFFVPVDHLIPTSEAPAHGRGPDIAANRPPPMPVDGDGTCHLGPNPRLHSPDAIPFQRSADGMWAGPHNDFPLASMSSSDPNAWPADTNGPGAPPVYVPAERAGGPLNQLHDDSRVVVGRKRRIDYGGMNVIVKPPKPLILQTAACVVLRDSADADPLVVDYSVPETNEYALFNPCLGTRRLTPVSHVRQCSPEETRLLQERLARCGVSRFHRGDIVRTIAKNAAHRGDLVVVGIGRRIALGVVGSDKRTLAMPHHLKMIKWGDGIKWCHTVTSCDPSPSETC